MIAGFRPVWMTPEPDLLDARVQRIYGGTSEIMREIIARAHLGAPGGRSR